MNLKKIPLDLSKDRNYADIKKRLIDLVMFSTITTGEPVVDAVDSVYYYHFLDHMDENGLTKFALMLAGSILEITSDFLEKEQAWGVWCDIKDFETGEFDDLVTKEDLDKMKEDIKTIKDYIKVRPYLLDVGKSESEIVNRWTYLG